jgi:hypothetical protein
VSDRTLTALSDDATLRAIAEGVEAEIGERFFSSLVRSLALALDVRYAFVTRLSDDGTHFKTLNRPTLKGKCFTPKDGKWKSLSKTSEVKQWRATIFA